MRGQQDGYILVAVLGVMLVLTGLIASSSMVASSALRGARADDAGGVLEGLLRAGLEVTAYQVFTLKLPLESVEGRRLRVDRGTVQAHLIDEASKVDVNASDPKLLSGAFRSIGMEMGTADALVTRVVAFRGVGQQASANPQSPPDPVTPPSLPASAAPATQAPHAGFRSVAAFIEFTGLDREEATALSPMLTVANPDGKVDVMTASRRVLMALPEMSDALADSIIADRRATAEADIDRLKTTLARQNTFVKFDSGPCYRAALFAKLDSGQTASATALIAASKSPNDPFYLFEWEGP